MAVMVGLDRMPGIIDEKLELVKHIILEQQRKGIFPVLGYSYYEYASSLKEGDVYSALLFSEYAQEISNLDMYFPKKSSATSIDTEPIIIFLLGLVLGLLISRIDWKNPRRPKKQGLPGKKR